MAVCQNQQSEKQNNAANSKIILHRDAGWEGGGSGQFISKEIVLQKLDSIDVCTNGWAINAGSKYRLLFP